MFLTVLRNAVQSVEGDGGNLTITAHSDSSDVRIEVRNEGSGIERETLDSIFDIGFSAASGRMKF